MSIPTNSLSLVNNLEIDKIHLLIGVTVVSSIVLIGGIAYCAFKYNSNKIPSTPRENEILNNSTEGSLILSEEGSLILSEEDIKNVLNSSISQTDVLLTQVSVETKMDENVIPEETQEETKEETKIDEIPEEDALIPEDVKELLTPEDMEFMRDQILKFMEAFGETGVRVIDLLLHYLSKGIFLPYSLVGFGEVNLDLDELKWAINHLRNLTKEGEPLVNSREVIAHEVMDMSDINLAYLFKSFHLLFELNLL